MLKIKKIILIPILFFLFTFIFVILDSGLEFNQSAIIIQPLIFAFSITISILFPLSRRFFIAGALISFCLMVITYLFNLIEMADWLGSLGFGVLFMAICSYLPNFIKKGYLEKY